MKCLKCNTELREGAKFCTHCGEKCEQPKKKLFCTNCGTELGDTGKFCIKCGANVEELKAERAGASDSKAENEHEQSAFTPVDVAGSIMKTLEHITTASSTPGEMKFCMTNLSGGQINEIIRSILPK